MYRLTITEPNAEPRPPLDIEVVPFLIGRVPDADLVLTESTVSGRHAQLEVHPDGRVVLRDLGSTNGTWVDGQRIDGGVWLPVPGTFRIGSTTMRLETTEPIAPRPGEELVGSAETVVVGVITGVAAVATAAPEQAAATPAVGPVAAPPVPAPAPAPAPAPGPPDLVPAAPAAPPPPARGVPVATPAIAAAARAPEPGGAGRAAVTPSSPAARVSSEPMPQPLGRALGALIIVGALQAVGGLIIAGVSRADTISEADASTLLALAMISVVAGVAEVGLALLARRRNRGAARLLLVLAIALTALAVWDALGIVDAGGNFYLLVLRISLNGVGAIGLFRYRAWFH